MTRALPYTPAMLAERHEPNREERMTDWTSPLPGSRDRVTFEGGRLDEVCGSAGAHLEHMGDDTWFLIIDHDDGSQTAVCFSSKDLKKPFMERRAPRT